MLYFKHSELVERFHVSRKTVHNWIEAAKKGKLDLELHEVGGRFYVAQTPNNEAVLERQAEDGKKYRTNVHHKVAEPTDDFYKLYSRNQILDIISSLNIHREIPRQYNYFDKGALSWERYAEQKYKEDGPNLLKSTIELLEANFSAIDMLIADHERVNVIDIGPGNALPVRGLLEHLLEKGKLHRYISLDISEKMLNIAERNINEWFNSSVKFEGYVRDITKDRFNDLVVDDLLDECADKTLNLVLFLGGTPMNFPEPYDLMKIIYNSMDSDDLLVYTDKPDTIAERRDFNVNNDSGMKALSDKYSFILDLLNIDETMYDVDLGFDKERSMRYIRVKFKFPLTIKFKFNKGERKVHFEKDETILLWRAWHQTSLEIISQFEKIGFALLQSSLTKDRQFLLTISGVDAKIS